VAEVVASFRNAPFLGQLLDILQHPSTAQRPDLRHFRPAADGRVRGKGLFGGVLGLGSGGGSGGAGAGVAAAVLMALVIAVLGAGGALGAGLLGSSPEARRAVRGAAARAWSWHPSMHRVLVRLHSLALALASRCRRTARRVGLPSLALRPRSNRNLALAAAVAVAPALVMAAVLGSAAGHGALPAAGAPQAATHLGPYLRSEVALSDGNQALSSRQGPAPWLRLVSIERGLAAQQDELAAQEWQIRRLVVNLGGHVADGDDAVVVGPDSPAQESNRLAALVAAHAATQAAYQRSLEAEYDLYRAAAEDPAQRSQLTQAVASAAPQAKEAVAYNLSLIQTQLAQEATIAQAEARLRALGSLTVQQVAAMRRHQPFIAPLVAPVTQPFGPTDFALEPPLSFRGTFYPHFHTGIDLGAPLDTPVHAAADGVVLLAAASVDSAGHLVGYGNYVVVAHADGFVTLYGHLDSVAVKAGQVVHQGEIVGLEGSTGWSTGPHVHFEIRHDGQFLDPAPYLAGQLSS
jgi:murein DD-endopeptidase MepM/ murein hydrolase activator NlpD